ncbi:MAG: HAMP domain-containing histidine kinase [Candidatus Eremiobacteraeota bacterium]|nr:HAMP domain-containing histidine kinase [Candidatus Eremiobacteraeota bacterium]MCW5871309.1 HAMP domain-containing histidine kinase [Candidatus Eremiobacteraeota bacterium]
MIITSRLREVDTLELRKKYPSTRRLLTLWNVVLIGALLVGLTLGLYFQIQKDLERRTYGQLRFQLLEHWEPAPPRREPPPRNSGADPQLRSSLHLVMPAGRQQKWSELASAFILVRYYQADLKKVVELGGPRERPEEHLDEIRRVLNGPRDQAYYIAYNSFEHWLMWAQRVRDQNGRVVGVLEVGMGSKPADDMLSDVASSMSIFGTLALLVGVLLAAALARYVCTPLESIVKKMQRVRSGDFSARAERRGPFEMQSIAVNFNRMVAELSQVFESQRRFVADASHELKTPLTSIQTMVELLRDYQQIPAERRERAFHVIERELGRVNTLVHDMLTLYRLDESNRQAELVDIGQMLEELASAYKPLHDNLDMEWEAITAELVDPAGCERAVRNLLDNALAHTSAPGRVFLKVGWQDGGLLIEVRDQGTGIPAEDLPRVTRRFYRSDLSRSRRSGGSGLGLSIVQSWVESNDGRLELESELGKGTLARLWLPQLLRVEGGKTGQLE